MTNAVAIRDLIRELSRGQGDPFGKLWSSWLQWPPDVFAFTSCVLQRSELYRFVVAPPEAANWDQTSAEWHGVLRDLPRSWVQWIEARLDQGKELPCPEPLKAWTDRVAAAVEALEDVPLDALAQEKWEHVSLLFQTHAVADLACAGMGVPSERAGHAPGVLYPAEASFQLSTRGTLAHFDTHIASVLPKMRTPQLGLTLRSLSHHVACLADGVSPSWVFPPAHCFPPDGERRFSLLLVPWSPTLGERFLVPVEPPHDGLDRTRFGFFRYESSYHFDATELARLASEAAGEVDGALAVVLPESALSLEQAEELDAALAREKVHLSIIGVRKDRESYSRLAVPAIGELSRHAKQHRWCLTKKQVRRFGLDWSLNPHLQWWEDIEPAPRGASFFCASEWLTISHVLAEDLVRSESLVRAIRAVGPHLVVALAFDGPQLEERWPGRYAGVLTDDPGSAVLTLTSFGAAQRYDRPAEGEARSPEDRKRARTIALWRDPIQGARELELPPGKSALLVTLAACSVTEWTADGRDDGGAAVQLRFVDARGIGPAPTWNPIATPLETAAATSPPSGKTKE